MTIRLGKEFHTTGLAEFPQEVYDLRSIELKLLETYTAERECHLEVAVGLANHLQQRLQSRDIRALGDVGNGRLVGIVVVIIMVCTNVEETIPAQMDNLMDFEIEANGFHVIYSLTVYYLMVFSN